jgi:RNA polymerase sigma-70 factor (ECF subfamily)
MCCQPGRFHDFNATFYLELHLMDRNGQNLAEFDLASLRAGDRAEFAHLVESTSTQMYRLGLKMLNDSEDAEDMLQETYLKALRALPAFEGRSSLTTWLYRIAVNEALMILRKRRPVVPVEDENLDDDDGLANPVQIVDFSFMPEKEMMAGEARRFLDNTIQKLSPGLRAVFLLRDVEGLSIKETADALNLTEMNVKTRLLRARLKLREDLSGYFGERLKGTGTDGNGSAL